jgi:hypothetical protein
VLAWLKRYWTAILIIVAAVVVADFVISSLATCHPPAPGSAEAVKHQDSQHCSYLHGPFLIGLEWLIDAIDEHDGFFVVLFTAVLAAFTAALWRSTDNLWAAGERQLAHLELSSERQLRAYVLPDVERSNYSELLGPDPTFNVWLKNSGQTPAHKVRSWASIKSAPFPLLTPLIAKDNIGPQSEAILAPGASQVIVIQLGKPLPDELKSRLENGSNAIYVFGCIEYVDVFGKPHFTKHRFMIGGPVPIRDSGHLTNCEDGNEAD